MNYILTLTLFHIAGPAVLGAVTCASLAHAALSERQRIQQVKLYKQDVVKSKQWHNSQPAWVKDLYNPVHMNHNYS